MGVDLKSVLQACRKAADQGYDIAKGNNDDLAKAINSSEQALRRLENQQFNNNGNKTPEYCTNYIKNMTDAQQSLSKLQNDVQKRLTDEKENLSAFKLVIYGRTKAGKSTLMEVLTKGDGSSIGLGAQRTTTDIREYQWNGMAIYDTPGIASGFTEGREDEIKAYHIAQSADLLVFLFSDDAPQQEEAKAFARLKQTGKPVLGIINCKSSDSSRSYSKMRLYDIRKKLTDARLDKIKAQFLQLASNGDGRWDNIQFVYTDLHTAFLSQLKEPPELAEHSAELYEISRFQQVENAVIDVVKSKGSFFQYKTFIDIIYHGSWSVFNLLQGHYQQGNIVLESLQRARNRLSGIRTRFERDARSQINSFLQQTERELMNAADSFAESNYDNKNAGRAWQRELNSFGIERAANRLMEEIAHDCEERINEFTKEFEQTISFCLSAQTDGIKGSSVFDYGRAVRIGTAVATIGLALAGLLTGPVGWVLAGIGILASLFESREEKIRKAINEMRSDLQDNINQIISSMRNELNNALQRNILNDYLGNVEKYFSEMFANTRSFLDLQRQLSDGINTNLLKMNRQLFTEALAHLRFQGSIPAFKNMARIPGEAVLIELKNNLDQNRKQEIADRLQELMQEEVFFIGEIKNIKKSVSDLLNIPEKFISQGAANKQMTISADMNMQMDFDTRLPELFRQLTGYVISVPAEIYRGRENDEKNETAFPAAASESVKQQTPDALSSSQEQETADPEQLWLSAVRYFNGDGVERNFAEALRIAVVAAEKGHMDAQRFVGDCYFFAVGTAQDFSKAILWYEIAEESGCAEASKYLGDCYYFGDGVQIDKEKAADYYRKAAEKGIREAQFNLGNAYYLGEGRPVDYEQAASLYQEAAEGEVAGAQNNLGNCYYLGHGKELNFSEAHKWYTAAVRRGCREAEENLANF